MVQALHHVFTHWSNQGSARDLKSYAHAFRIASIAHRAVRLFERIPKSRSIRAAHGLRAAFPSAHFDAAIVVSPLLSRAANSRPVRNASSKEYTPVYSVNIQRRSHRAWLLRV